jgi:hypothetical protein
MAVDCRQSKIFALFAIGPKLLTEETAQDSLVRMRMRTNHEADDKTNDILCL